MSKSKQKIQIYLHKLKDLLNDEIITKDVYDLIYNNRYVKEIDSDDKELCYKEFRDVYIEWYGVKSGGDVPFISILQVLKVKSIISQLRYSALNFAKYNGNKNPIKELVDLELLNSWRVILSANINTIDLEYCKSNQINTFDKARTFWDIKDDPNTIYYGKMTTITSIEKNLDQIKTNIRLRNEQARNNQGKTIGGISISKLQSTSTSIPIGTDHLR